VSNTPLSDRTWVDVNLEAVRANARTVASRAASARLLPMVKADAYGLGAIPVVRALEPLDPWGYGVATAEEGRELREAGITRRIVVFQPTRPMLEPCARWGLTPTLGEPAAIAAWCALGTQPFHVDVDTGMNRSGLWWEAFGAQAAAFRDAPGFEGVLTHFHSADRDDASVAEQWRRFEAALATLPRRPELVHAANSAAALGHPEVAGDLVRPGIFLYGGAAGTAVRPEPVVTWRARICRIAQRERGATVSYGATYRATGPTCITTIAAGYADGVRRALSNRGAVLIEGRRAPIAGTVTMDFTMAAPDAEPAPGALATLIGTDGGATITLDEMAATADTISYEILTGLGRRVARRYGGQREADGG